MERVRPRTTSWCINSRGLARWNPGSDAHRRAGARTGAVDVLGRDRLAIARRTNGPIDLPAGEATISVGTGEGSDRSDLPCRPLPRRGLSQLYEANVPLETTATARLLPVTYHEVIDEGRRRIDRRLEFDFPRHEVRIASGGTTISLPLGLEARDP